MTIDEWNLEELESYEEVEKLFEMFPGKVLEEFHGDYCIIRVINDTEEIDFKIKQELIPYESRVHFYGENTYK